MPRKWTSEQKKAHSDKMRNLWKSERIRKHAGLKQKTKLRVGWQRVIVFVD